MQHALLFPSVIYLYHVVLINTFIVKLASSILALAQPDYKKVRGQSEARLQVIKTSDIKEDQKDKL